MTIEIEEGNYPNGSVFGIFRLDGKEIGKADKKPSGLWTEFMGRTPRTADETAKAMLKKIIEKARAREKEARRLLKLLDKPKEQRLFDPVLPDYINPEAWAGFVEMRKRKKAPLTARATDLIIADLAKWHAAGQDVNFILDRSTKKGWTDVYEVKEQVNRFYREAPQHEPLRVLGEGEET